MILRRKAARGENSYPRLFIFYKAGRGPSSAIKGAKKAKTATFPSTLRAVQKSAFGGSALLRSVVLNEGLEKLGRAFQGTHIEELAVPSTLRECSAHEFCDCDSLKLVWVEDARIENFRPQVTVPREC